MVTHPTIDWFCYQIAVQKRMLKSPAQTPPVIVIQFVVFGIEDGFDDVLKKLAVL